jgi:glycosyltransferase involved in cell wall biosynthesis
MKILLLCKKFPFPLKDGESIAVHSLSRALHELGCEVSLLAMNTSKHYFNIEQGIPPELSHYRRIQTVQVDNRIRLSAAFFNLFSSDSYHIARFESAAYAKRLTEMLAEEDYDVIQLETLYLAPYVPLIRSKSEALVVMRAHNVEHEIWERMVRQSKPGPRRWYLRHLTRKLKAFEERFLNSYDMLAPITLRDLHIFRNLGCQIPAVVTPIGLNADDYQPDYGSFRSPPSISFIGSLDWMPNLEGLEWFLAEVWPQIRRKYPEVELHIAGRNTPAHLFNLRQPNVFIHGEVPDAARFISAHSLMVVPLLSGSGMRAKILEGMVLGKVVISTSLGLEGIGARHKQEALVANDAAQFLQALDYLFRKPARFERMGRQAQEFAEREYNHTAIARRLLAHYQTRIVAEVQP